MHLVPIVYFPANEQFQTAFSMWPEIETIQAHFTKMNGPHSAHQAAKPSREAMRFHPVDKAISLVPPFSQVQLHKIDIVLLTSA